MAIGFTGEPVVFVNFKGAILIKNSHLLLAAHSSVFI